MNDQVAVLQIFARALAYNFQWVSVQLHALEMLKCREGWLRFLPRTSHIYAQSNTEKQWRWWNANYAPIAF